MNITKIFNPKYSFIILNSHLLCILKYNNNNTTFHFLFSFFIICCCCFTMMMMMTMLLLLHILIPKKSSILSLLMHILLFLFTPFYFYHTVNFHFQNYFNSHPFYFWTVNTHTHITSLLKCKSIQFKQTNNQKKKNYLLYN